jgi:hypothetical protein
MKYLSSVALLVLTPGCAFWNWVITDPDGVGPVASPLAESAAAGTEAAVGGMGSYGPLGALAVGLTVMGGTLTRRYFHDRKNTED